MSLKKVSSLAALTALVVHDPDDICWVKDSRQFWEYAAASTATHDGVDVIKPTNKLATQAGRWLRTVLGLGSESVELENFSDESGAVVNQGLQALNVFDAPEDFVEGDTITIGADTYEIRSGGGEAPGNIGVEVAGQYSPGVVLPLLRIAIETLGTEEVNCLVPSANQLIIRGLTPGVLALACSSVCDDPTNAWQSAVMFGGAAPSVTKMGRASRVPSAEEVASGFMHFLFPFQVAAYHVEVRVTATGVLVPFGGEVALANNAGAARLTLENDTDPDFAEAHTVRVLAFE
jgi:hypothetical protein